MDGKPCPSAGPSARFSPLMTYCTHILTSWTTSIRVPIEQENAQSAPSATCILSPLPFAGNQPRGNNPQLVRVRGRVKVRVGFNKSLRVKSTSLPRIVTTSDTMPFFQYLGSKLTRTAQRIAPVTGTSYLESKLSTTTNVRY